MSLNYSYIVQRAGEWTPEQTSRARLLDYGCGAKAVIVRLALDSGFDAHGVDPFYEGGVGEERAKVGGLWGTRIHRLGESGQIPMEDESFDIVTANQVFEHIDDFSVPLSEIARVLKPRGIFVNVFPSSTIWREGHIGIPFSHWFPRDTRLRYLYVLSARTLGLGRYKNGKSRTVWAKDGLKWIDTWTFYKPLSEIIEHFNCYFNVEMQEADYFRYRIERHGILRYGNPLGRRKWLEPVLRSLAHRLSGHVFLLRKKE
jgi:ubiquinone/menaquinone biosynthesis C-methylase UbiE